MGFGVLPYEKQFHSITVVYRVKGFFIRILPGFRENMDTFREIMRHRDKELPKLEDFLDVL